MTAEHKITWFGKGREGVPDIKHGKGSVEDIVSYVDVVQTKLAIEAKEIRRQAEIFLESAPEHRTGDAQIDVLKPPESDLDWKVYIYDPSGKGAALSIENGHYVHRGNPDDEFHPDYGLEGRAWVEGIHPIARAVELAIKRGKAVT